MSWRYERYWVSTGEKNSLSRRTARSTRDVIVHDRIWHEDMEALPVSLRSRKCGGFAVRDGGGKFKSEVQVSKQSSMPSSCHRHQLALCPPHPLPLSSSPLSSLAAFKSPFASNPADITCAPRFALQARATVATVNRVPCTLCSTS